MAGRFTVNELENAAAEAARTVAPIFRQRGWRYGRCGVPDEADLAVTLHHLLAGVCEEEGDACRSTGRLTANKWTEEAGTECIEVSLSLGTVERDLEDGPPTSDPARVQPSDGGGDEELATDEQSEDKAVTRNTTKEERR